MNESASPLPELPAVGFLAEVPVEHRAFLTAFGKFRRPQNGEVFIAEGSPQDALSLVLSGTLHVVSDASGRTTLLARVGEGVSIGGIHLFDPATPSATRIVRSNCLIWSVTRAELDGLIEADALVGLSVMKGLLRQLSGRIRMMNEKLAVAEHKSTLHDLWSARKS